MLSLLNHSHFYQRQTSREQRGKLNVFSRQVWKHWNESVKSSCCCHEACDDLSIATILCTHLLSSWLAIAMNARPCEHRPMNQQVYSFDLTGVSWSNSTGNIPALLCSWDLMKQNSVLNSNYGSNSCWNHLCRAKMILLANCPPRTNHETVSPITALANLEQLHHGHFALNVEMCFW